MPRGRHRHSPPLHRLLPPTAIAGVSLVCALGPWVFAEQAVLRVSAAVAAATAAVGAAVMRRWDVEAGKRVADLTRARASDEWRHEEKVAELETDLEESRELRTKLEHKLRAKRAELANLRNEHAALLRRYATAETERASALEGRRLLEIETAAPGEGRALAAGSSGAGTAGTAGAVAGAGTFAQATPVPPQGVPVPGAPWGARGSAAGTGAGAVRMSESGAVAVPGADGDVTEEGEEVEKSVEAEETEGGGKAAVGVFSPAGSSLFLRANSALERIITQRAAVREAEEREADAGAESAVDVESDAVGVEAEEGDAAAESEVEAEAAEEEAEVEAEAMGQSDRQAGDAAGDESAEAGASKDGSPKDGSGKGGSPKDGSPKDGSPKDGSPKDGSGKGGSPEGDPDGPTGGGSRQGRPNEADAEQAPVPVVAVEESDPAKTAADADRHEKATAAEPLPTGPVPAPSVTARAEAVGSEAVGSEAVGSEAVGTETRVTEAGGAEVPAAEGPLPGSAGLPVVRPAGHFTVPTAVAVVPAVPQRRAAVEGGFDFFGTNKESYAIADVQNEDLADVVGQEALALHKAESEAEFKRVDEASRGIGQVIDLTAHDETEQIDLKGLRTAAS
ncbi:hypothetical protein ACWD4G_35070 [Streptomyces sp. NPDC002643]